MEILQNFPITRLCPVCLNNKNEKYIMVNSTNYDEDNMPEKLPVHVDCILENIMIFEDLDILAVKCKNIK